MIEQLIKRFIDYKKRVERRSPWKYFFLIFRSPHMVITVATFSNMTMLVMLAISNIINLKNSIEYKMESRNSSNHSLHFDVKMGSKQYTVTHENIDNFIIYILVFHLGIVTIFFLANFFLLKTTFKPFLIKRHLKSIIIWLLIHTTHMIYSLFFDNWIGVFNSSNYIMVINITNYLLKFLLLWMVSWTYVKIKRNLGNIFPNMRRSRLIR
ncbi:uncharacterized protein LOC112595533 [Melanaphis sacchari]|uniref:uncharacterized protein LOC112595533 n=1 Tax=Melanaphis sacchari TaxID=742174 RepID=UPI000DC1477C|nr:uncharacterized protein LOC112595533 [Melanaphis sacchari]